LSHRFPCPTKVSSEKNVRNLELGAYLGQKKPVAQKDIFTAKYFYRNVVCQNVSSE